MTNRLNKKGSMALILVLNVFLAFLAPALILYDAKLAINILGQNNTLSDLRAQLDRSESFYDSLNKNHDYINGWHEEDRKHFNGLLEDPTSSKPIIYNEYIELNKNLAALEKRAYHDPKGYILFDPLLSDAYIALELAIMARATFLTGNFHSDSFNEGFRKNYYVEMDEYYNYLYGFRDELLSNIDMVVYNQEKYIEAIDKLSLPVNYYNGLKIFPLNRNCNTAGGATIGTLTGKKDIVIFNLSQNIDSQIDSLVHEIGHVVGYDLFSEFKTQEDSYIQLQESEDALNEYAAIYGKTDYFTRYTDSDRSQWGDSLYENFAEDFAHIYNEKNKISNWQGDHQEEVNAFIEEGLIQEDNLAQFKEGKVAFGDGDSGFEATLHDDRTNVFYTKKSEITIKFDGLEKNSRSIQVFWDPSKENNFSLSNALNNENSVELTFPNKGEYEMYILSDWPNSSHSISYYKLLITYEP